MLGSEGKQPHRHKRALLFVDNSGADVILGMLPLAREFLRRGTEVRISLSPSLSNDKLLEETLKKDVFVIPTGCSSGKLSSCS